MQARRPAAISARQRPGAGAVLARRSACARLGAAALIAAGIAGSAMTPAAAQGPACTKMEFEAVVSDAAGALRELNAQNRPAFQAKLRALKDKRGWSHDQFLKEAAPLVQDAKAAEYDKESGDYLAKIQSMGAEGAAAKEPDCNQLVELKSYMQALVKSQKAKWQYMLAKVEQELGK